MDAIARAPDKNARQLRARSALLLALLGCLAARAQAQTTEALMARMSGAEIYRVACAQCHGADGRGALQAVVALPVAPPNFADCKVATAEPDADWHAVVWVGGPARAFSETMPAFGRALSDSEIQRALDHIRSFCGNRSNWPRGELNLPRPLVTEKAYPEDEVVLTTSYAFQQQRQVINRFVYERRFGPGAQLEISIPFGWVQRTRDTSVGARTDWTGGVGDIAIGFKQVMLHSLKRGVILSVGGERNSQPVMKTMSWASARPYSSCSWPAARSCSSTGFCKFRLESSCRRGKDAPCKKDSGVLPWVRPLRKAALAAPTTDDRGAGRTRAEHECACRLGSAPATSNHAQQTAAHQGERGRTGSAHANEHAAERIPVLPALGLVRWWLAGGLVMRARAVAFIRITTFCDVHAAAARKQPTLIATSARAMCVLPATTC
jgi:mono/diheme cytochrome c family protein